MNLTPEQERIKREIAAQEDMLKHDMQNYYDLKRLIDGRIKRIRANCGHERILHINPEVEGECNYKVCKICGEEL